MRVWVILFSGRAKPQPSKGGGFESQLRSYFSGIWEFSDLSLKVPLYLLYTQVWVAERLAMLSEQGIQHWESMMEELLKKG